MKNKLILSTVAAAIAIFGFTGCSEDSDNGMSVANGNSNIRVIHTSYDAPAVDVQLDGTVAISNLAYGISSGFAEVESGNRNIKVTPTGATQPVVIDADVVLDADKSYTVFATGSLSSIEPVVVEDNRTANMSKARIRFAHMAPDAPAVDIKLNDGNGPVVFGNTAFSNVTSYADVDGGSYVFAVTAANATEEVVVFDPIMVENGKVYTVVAHGTLDANDAYPFAARVFVDNGSGDQFVDLTANGTANVMVVHASPDAPGVDLLVDDAVAGTNLTFPNDTGYLAVVAGMRNLKVNVTGSSTTVIDADVDFMRDTYYSVFAIDSVAKIKPLVIEDDLSAPAAGKAHVRFIHLSPNAPAVDITTTNGDIVFGNVAFSEYSAFTPLDAGTYDLQVRLQGTDTVVLNLPGIVLEDGKIYTVFAKGFVGETGSKALDAQIIVNM